MDESICRSSRLGFAPQTVSAAPFSRRGNMPTHYNHALKLKLENKNILTTSKASLYGVQFGPVNESIDALASKVLLLSSLQQGISDIGGLLVSYSSLSFVKEKIEWSPLKPSRVTEKPWQALYG